MRTALSGVLGIVLSILGLAGCGTLSIPRVAAQGTTILIPVPDAFGAGFGRALSNNPPFGDIDLSDNVVPFYAPIEDFQRGELLFALRTGPTTNSPRVTYLPVRYITRVHADEASGAGLPAQGENFINVGTPVQTGQIVAFVDIPYQPTLLGDYYVFIERWRRESAGSSNFVQLTPKQIDFNGQPLPWVGWAGTGGWGGLSSSPDAGMKIKIVAQTEGSAFYTGRGYDRWNEAYSFLDHMDDLEHLVPNLKLRIWIGSYNPPTFPAAWEITLAYPAGKIEVTGATLGRVHRSGGLVSVSTTGSPSACEAPGTVRISMIDPDQYSQWVDVAYRLRNPTCGRATVGDFTPVGATKAYDIDGNPITALAFLDPEYDF